MNIIHPALQISKKSAKADVSEEAREFIAMKALDEKIDAALDLARRTFPDVKGIKLILIYDYEEPSASPGLVLEIRSDGPRATFREASIQFHCAVRDQIGRDVYNLLGVLQR